MTAPKFLRLIFSVHLVRQLPVLGKKRKAEVQNLSATCASDDFGSYSAAVPVGGKIWKGDCRMYLEGTKSVFIQKEMGSIILFFILLISDGSLYIDLFVLPFKLD